jgi:hypothetical protein
MPVLFVRYVLLAMLLAPATAVAQTPAERAAVERAVLDYVEGFYEGDTVKLVRSIRPEVTKFGYSIPRDSTRYVGEAMAWSEFLSYARGIKERNRQAPATAPKKVEIFDIQDQTASAKLTAWWGTDYLLLAKYDGRWMIRMVLWQSPRKP